MIITIFYFFHRIFSFSHFSSLFHRHIFLYSHLVLILFSLGRVHSVNPCNFTVDFFTWIFVFPRDVNPRSEKKSTKNHTPKKTEVEIDFPWILRFHGECCPTEQPNQSHPWKPKIHDPRVNRTHPKKLFFFKSEEDFFNVIHILSFSCESDYQP